MEEQTFFSKGAVTVTNARFINGGQTYAMRNVTSVKSEKTRPSIWGGLLVIFVGLIAVGFNPLISGLIVAAGVAYLVLRRTTYHVMLATSGGEVSALNSRDKLVIDLVVAAVNEAIVQRG